ncbi:uncharacterized protein LOC115718080 [Cannabis sativa]|uniref:uncharacterized protein LOC115718080 n=1 Tax=Cannabis sativa TaxID=3483 RepID=UPI0029CA6A75|nr:uncharacterized protein LOC115718080 [Cannabis sativa]
MMVFSRLGGNKQQRQSNKHLRKPFIIRNISTSDLRFHDMVDPNGSNPSKNIVIVMDGLAEFTTEVLQWVLHNIVINCSGCVITLLGVMPWLNIPLSTKTWLDIWSVDLEELAKERSENIKNDFKYLKLKAVLDLCRSYGVVLQKKVVMGYPSRHLVIEQIISLDATWVVFDRHQKKTEFYGEKVGCKMIVMNERGEADMIIDNKLVESTTNFTRAAGELSTNTELHISDQQCDDDNEIILHV